VLALKEAIDKTRQDKTKHDIPRREFLVKKSYNDIQRVVSPGLAVYIDAFSNNS
jgi:hypothetical protein